MAKPYQEQITDLMEDGYNPFVILFSWDFEADKEATLKMNNLHEKFEEMGIQYGEGWYLTGNRTMIVLGYVRSNIELQKLCLSVTYDTPIQADVYHAIDVHDLASVVGRKPKGKTKKYSKK